MSALTAKDVFCEATIEKMGEGRLNRFLRCVFKELAGRSDVQDSEMQEKLLKQACINAGRQIFGDDSSTEIQGLLGELKTKTSGHASAHGVNAKSQVLLHRRRNN